MAPFALFRAGTAPSPGPGGLPPPPPSPPPHAGEGRVGASGRDARGPKVGRVGRDEVNDWIAGNLCRGTGHRPFIDARLPAWATRAKDRLAGFEAETPPALAELDVGRSRVT